MNDGSFSVRRLLEKRVMLGRRLETSWGSTETTSEQAFFSALVSGLWLRYRAAVMLTPVALWTEVERLVNRSESSSGRQKRGIEWMAI